MAMRENATIIKMCAVMEAQAKSCGRAGGEAIDSVR